MLHRVEDRFVHRARHEQRADRDVAARERLRDGDEVGLEPPVLEREHPPGAAEAGLHLVDAEERAVAAAELLRALEVAGGRQVDALALDRLDEEHRDVLALQLALERLELAERHAVEAGQERAEAVGELRVAVRRERAEREPVEPVVGRDDARALRRGAAELERRLDRFGAAAREEAALEPRRRAREELLREQSGERRDAEREHPGVSRSSASTSAARTARLLRPTLYIPKPPSMSR